MCMRREELEYSTEEEVANNDAYVAPPVNRFRTNYKILHMMQTAWSLEQKIRSVYAFTHRPGNRRTLASFAKLTPQMLADCYNVVAEHKRLEQSRGIKRTSLLQFVARWMPCRLQRRTF